MPEAADILIVGGGPTGATFALGLANCGLDVVVLEARAHPQTAGDSRAIALSGGSRLILQRLGVWQQLAPVATPIRTIHISQRGRFGRSLLRAAETGQPALGYVVGYAELASAIDAALVNSGIRVLRGAHAQRVVCGAQECCVEFEYEGKLQKRAAALTVVADGGRSLEEIPGLQRQVREYDQHALVATVRAELPHDGTAYERFTPQGPVALLPWGEGAYALVWTAAPETVEHLRGLDENEFLRQLHAHFGDLAGGFTHVSNRSTFPLKLAWLRPNTAPHLAIIGNAAQTLHPVAGQGFNLGLRDAWELAGLVASMPKTELGAEAMLAEYRKLRRLDTGGGMWFTDFLVRTFSNDWPGLGHMRGAALTALELCQPARGFVVRKMSLGARG